MVLSQPTDENKQANMTHKKTSSSLMPSKNQKHSNSKNKEIWIIEDVWSIIKEFMIDPNANGSSNTFKMGRFIQLKSMCRDTAFVEHSFEIVKRTPKMLYVRQNNESYYDRVGAVKHKPKRVKIKTDAFGREYCIVKCVYISDRTYSLVPYNMGRYGVRNKIVKYVENVIEPRSYNQEN